MCFINKWACTAACVLVYKNCPSHDTMHETDDYPMYYMFQSYICLHSKHWKQWKLGYWQVAFVNSQWSKLIFTSSTINDTSLTSTMYSKQMVLFYQPWSRPVQTPKTTNLVPGLDSSFLCANSWWTEHSFHDELQGFHDWVRQGGQFFLNWPKECHSDTVMDRSLKHPQSLKHSMKSLSVLKLSTQIFESLGYIHTH